MPTYEYACKACGEHLEVVQSFTDDALTKCPACGKKQLRKVFGSIGITFKGSGFYKTDSRSGSSSSSKPSEAAASSDSGSSSKDASSSKESSTPKESSSSKDSSSKDSSSGSKASTTSSGTSAA